jgi:hypothetical protein
MDCGAIRNLVAKQRRRLGRISTRLNANRCRNDPTAVLHVDEERRAKVCSVVPQGPCPTIKRLADETCKGKIWQSSGNNYEFLKRWSFAILTTLKAPACRQEARHADKQ